MSASWVRILAALLVCLALGALWAGRVTGRAIEKDAAQTVQMALNLERHGVIALEESPPFTPTDYREPLPVLVCALAIKVMDVAIGSAPPQEYFQGRRVQLLKYQNILWLALLSLGTFWATRYFTGSFYAGLLGTLLVNFALVHASAQLIDDLYTDIPAAALLMLASIAVAVATVRRGPAFYVLTGFLFGALTLVKAATLYVFIGTAAGLAGVFLLQRVIPIRLALRNFAILAVSFGCTVAPWMYRNHELFGSAQISQRAGVVLMYRAVYNEMTPLEYRGTFYVWAPPHLKGFIGRLLGFAPADLERNGRLQHLNDEDSAFAADDLAAERAGAPDRTLSFYRQARAERVKLERELSATGRPQSDIEADDVLKARAMTMIRAHPGRELALTVAFLWRGALLAFPLLLIALLTGLRARRYDLLLFALPAFGTVMLYALFTHFIARYDLPAFAVAIVAFMASLQLALRARAASKSSGVP
jgi:hypothetical protein